MPRSISGPVSTIYLIDPKQRSQTRGPREGPMQPASIRNNGYFKRNIGQIDLFSQDIGY
jgi:hypothetical protein